MRQFSEKHFNLNACWRSLCFRGLRRRVLFLAFAVLCGTTALQAQSNSELNQKITDAFKRVYGENVQLDFRQVALDDSAIARVKALSQSRYGKSVGLHIVKKGKSISGFGIVDDVHGKEQPITYMLMVDTNLKIKDIEVLYYREAYGGEIQNDVWRNQFKGKSQNDNLRVGNGIQNISGATISTNAVTYGVRKLLALFMVLRERNLL